MSGSEIQAAMILAGICVVIGFIAWIARRGGDRAIRKVLEDEVKARNEFEKRGEDWDAASIERRADELKRLRKLRKGKVPQS